MRLEHRPVATLHLTCGLPCAGKTTLARRLAQERGALRLTVDEWIVGLYGDGVTFELQQRIRDGLERQLLGLALRVLPMGIDVVLDFGVWAREEREEFRARAAAAGARSELHTLIVPLDELVRRAQTRNPTAPPAFRITRAQLAEWETWFQPPAADELAPRNPPPAPAA